MKNSAIESTPHVAAPLLLSAALFTAAGGYVHLREWVHTYRAIPASAPGSALVRIGFPVNAAASAVLALALVACAFHRFWKPSLVVAAAVAFEAGSLAFLILSRTGSVFGWAEPIWTRGADQTRAVEIGALLTLAAVAAAADLSWFGPRLRRVGATVARRPAPTAA